MAVIGSISVNVLAARMDKFEADMKKGAKATGKFGKDSTKSIKKVHGALKGIIGLLGNGALVRGFQSVTSSIDQLAKTSSKLGIATDKLVGLRHAGEQTGVAINTMDMAVQRMTRRVSEAAKGTGEAKDAIKELGLSATELAKMSPEKQFAKIADAMGNVGSQNDKVRLAFKLFDSEGVALVNTLALGSAGLNKFQKDAEDLGITLSGAEAKRIEKFNDQIDRLVKLIGSQGRGLIIDASPELIAAADALLKFSRGTIGGYRAYSRAVGGASATAINPIANAGDRVNAMRDRRRMAAAASRVDPVALGFEGRGEGTTSPLQARANELRGRNARREMELQQNPFPTMSAAAQPGANMQALQSAGKFGAKIGKAMGESFVPGFEKAYKSFRNRFTLVGALRKATGITEELHDKDDEKNKTGPLRAIDASSSAGFAALRRNLNGDQQREDRKVKGIEQIVKNTANLKTSTVEEVGL